MKRILTIGNLPKHMQVMAKETGGRLSKVAQTQFFEANSISEFEKKAVEIGYEIVPTIDGSTNRGFLVGFDVTEPKRVATLVDYSQLMMYFVECSEKEVIAWTDRIKNDRRLQEADMRKRREKSQASKMANYPLKIIK